MNTEVQPLVQPLPLQHRKRTFWLLLALFFIALPFLFLYATGYRFEFGEHANLISTGGMYIGAERTGAEIYIDNELVRETRVFRRAFYAQSLEPGTHRVHVQRTGAHTWVKELPVSPHLVTEAQAFNLPLVPQVRVITPWQSATGAAVTPAFSLHASTTNIVLATTTIATSTLVQNTEYESLHELFVPTVPTTTEEIVPITGTLKTHTLEATTTATTSVEIATTTIVARDVTLFADGGEVYARWVGPRSDMPYYYCAPDFPSYSTSTEAALTERSFERAAANTAEFIHPIQTIPADAPCDPTIRIDRQGQEVISFDFLPGSTDLVLLTLSDGVYVIEIDDRAWQNIQPLLLGENLNATVENGQVYVYDGTAIYQVILEY